MLQFYTKFVRSHLSFFLEPENLSSLTRDNSAKNNSWQPGYFFKINIHLYTISRKCVEVDAF